MSSEAHNYSNLHAWNKKNIYRWQKKIPSVPFIVMKRQWKMELKKLGFFIKAVSSNTGLGLSGLSELRNGILQLAFSFKKTPTHICSASPFFNQRHKWGRSEIKIRTVYWKQWEKKRNSSNNNINSKNMQKCSPWILQQ